MFSICAYLCASVAILSSQSQPGYLLPTGWRIQPVGQQIPLDKLPMSTAVSPDGKYLLVLNSGSDTASISVIAVESMRELSRVPVADAWLGLCFSPDGSRVYVGGGSKYSVFEFSFSSGQLKPTRQIEIAPKAKPGAEDFIGDVAVSPDGASLYAADLFHDSVIAIDARNGQVTGKFKTGRRPYRILMHPDGKSFFVSSWAEGAVYWHETKAGSEIMRLRMGPHPTDMVLSDRKSSTNPGWHYRLFVTVANTNNVFVAGVTDQNTMQVIETLKVGATESQPAGTTPSALALSIDQSRLFVVCSDANVVAVANIAEDRSRLEGFIPTGRYPTAARMLPGGRLAILNGHAISSAETGSMSVVDSLTEDSLDSYTKSAAALNPYRDEQLDVALEKPSPIQHVIYVIKGDRSFDQVFGSPDTAPNHTKLAREFMQFDHYYVPGSSEPEGQNWAVAAIAPDFTERMLPNVVAKRSGHNRFEGGELANSPPAGYLWSNALAAGLSVRNYGEFVENKPQAGTDGVQVARFNDPSLPPITNTHYRGDDPAYSDVERVRVFLNDLKQAESGGDLPRLSILRLGNDRSAAGLADNDQALGMLAEAVSHSRFWPSTAILVTEGDSPAGERSVLLAISPYTHLGVVDTEFYNQASVLRTIDLILGLRPMTTFDAAARPIGPLLTGSPVTAPYTAANH